MSTLGQDLYDAGWRQGARIPGSVPQAHYALIGEGVREEAFPAGMDLVLTTQDCDLVKDEQRLPYVEAIGCIDDSDHARAVRANDARFYVLDPAQGTLADRAYGAFLTRQALAALPVPEPPCGGDSKRVRRFANWLGARYDRPALPTPAVEHIQRPLVASIRRLCGRNRPHEQLNRDLHEIRVVGDLSQGPPFVLDLVIFLIRDTASPQDCELGIAEVLEGAGFSVSGLGGGGSTESTVTIRNWFFASPAQLSIAAYQEAQPIPLAYESLDGEELIGAEPLDAESA